MTTEPIPAHVTTRHFRYIKESTGNFILFKQNSRIPQFLWKYFSNQASDIVNESNANYVNVSAKRPWRFTIHLVCQIIGAC